LEFPPDFSTRAFLSNQRLDLARLDFPPEINRITWSGLDGWSFAEANLVQNAGKLINDQDNESNFFMNLVDLSFER